MRTTVLSTCSPAAPWARRKGGRSGRSLGMLDCGDGDGDGGDGDGDRGDCDGDV